AGRLSAGGPGQVVFRLDVGGADDVWRDGDNDVALAAGLFRRRKQTAENRDHADHRDRDAAVAFVVLLDAGDDGRDAVLHARDRGQRTFGERRRKRGVGA